MAQHNIVQDLVKNKQATMSKEQIIFLPSKSIREKLPIQLLPGDAMETW